LAGSESVFNIIQMGAQSGTAYAPGSAVPATILFPVDSPITFDLDRASQFPKQDRGRNVRNSAGQGFHGVRGAGCTLPAQASFEYLMDVLEMHACGGVVPTGGPAYVWTYPFEALTPTTVPRTIEGGNTDASQTQMQLSSCLVDQLTMGFPDIIAPGAFPWTLSATVLAFDRTINALTVSGAGTNEIQAVVLAGGGLGGTWMGAFNGVATSPIAFNISTADLQTALRALSTVGGANVTVGGTPGNYTVTFIGSLAATNVPMLVGNASGLTGSGPSPSITITQSTAGVPAAAVAPRSGMEIMQGHLTTLLEGTTATAFASLTELAGSLKSYTQTTNRQLARRAYGGSTDIPVRYGFKDMSGGTFEAKIGVSVTSKSDFHDIWNAASPAPLGERRWRLKVIGTGTKQMVIDSRVGIMAVPTDEVDGERIFKVSGEFVDDSTLGAPLQWAVTNGVASL
jgi:hypothetical protein